MLVVKKNNGMENINDSVHAMDVNHSCTFNVANNSMPTEGQTSHTYPVAVGEYIMIETVETAIERCIAMHARLDCRSTGEIELPFEHTM
jgi:hypothetical protein